MYFRCKFLKGISLSTDISLYWSIFLPNPLGFMSFSCSANVRYKLIIPHIKEHSLCQDTSDLLANALWELNSFLFSSRAEISVIAADSRQVTAFITRAKSHFCTVWFSSEAHASQGHCDLSAGECTALVLPELNAENKDTDHGILVDTPIHRVGIYGTALDWHIVDFLRPIMPQVIMLYHTDWLSMVCHKV